MRPAVSDAAGVKKIGTTKDTKDTKKNRAQRRAPPPRWQGNAALLVCLVCLVVTLLLGDTH